MADITDNTKVSVRLLIYLLGGAASVGATLLRGEQTRDEVASLKSEIVKIQTRNEKDEEFKRELDKKLSNMELKLDLVLDAIGTENLIKPAKGSK